MQAWLSETIPHSMFRRMRHNSLLPGLILERRWHCHHRSLLRSDSGFNPGVQLALRQDHRPGSTILYSDFNSFLAFNNALGLVMAL